MSARALLGIGGNIGDVEANMRRALTTIDGTPGTRVVAVSRLYRTPPWGVTDQPFFFNACAAVETTLSPRDLLELCLATERGLKRERRERWGPRTIDLDVLDYAGQTYEDEALTLPHPRIGARAFVLVPLADIAPETVVDGMTVTERLVGLDRAGIEPANADGAWWREPDEAAPTAPAPSA
ncbi:2-amino-4-hydroxy-6-hydroxymethyldihydropteridine diphosphokinase [Aureimonas glaciei]|uniref:2-amino-4-hydroxy-6-hydroxymethyldihydropteridine pyrophosphokinase n=1 Tax=Aureimonas glaciei TaxID=1776957 RepID=A0A916XWN6_9HYPH|nr:2-amino-4-hydroxy-6-hydroxymethyldihydropteridine diphosphokinase [Aureimonas glaciei]GGD18103.1 2-amino-4-hydroxy-6-hydroxymethyldihydropteridine diphosphokinase [Aureimonas glaciei]